MSESFDGAEQLLKKLGQIDQNIRSEIMKKAVGKGAHLVRSSAVLLCPKDTGELKDSIFVTVEQNQNETQGTVYTNKSYAPYVEFGTGPVGAANHSGISPEVTPTYRQTGWGYYDDESWHYTNGQPAQPFMYPALKNNEETITKQISKEIVNELRKYITK